MNKKIKLVFFCLIFLTENRLTDFDWNKFTQWYWMSFGPVACVLGGVLLIGVGQQIYQENFTNLEEQINHKRALLCHNAWQSEKLQAKLRKMIFELEVKLEKAQQDLKKKQDEGEKTPSTLHQALDVEPEIKELAEKVKSQSNNQNEQAGSHNFFRQSEQGSELIQTQNYNLNYRLNGHNNNLNYNVFENMGINIRNAYHQMREYYQNKLNRYAQEAKEGNIDITMWY